MIDKAIRFYHSGLFDWFVQRATALLMTAYLIFILFYLVINPDLSYGQWEALNRSAGMRVFTLLTMIAMLSHAWIGNWCVLTDYVTVRLIGPKANFMRNFIRFCMGILSFAYFIWAINILWRI
jgi:succinate dehydrogenase / fumarate reductase membrane anchor subunit